MNDELLSILGSARRRVMAVRAAESAAAAVVAGALAAAAGELAWAAATRWLWAGLAIAVVPAVVAVAWAIRKTRDRTRFLRQELGPVAGFPSPWLLAGVCVAVAAIAAGGILAGLHLHWPKAAVAAVGVLLAAGAGTAVALARGPGLRQVAARLDAKAGLRERLSTAVEVALSSGPVSPSAPVVRAQALAAMAERRPQDSPMGSVSPALPAGAALALAVCLAMAFLPDFAPSPPAGAVRQFSQKIATMSPSQRRELAQALRQAASQPALSPAAAKELARAAIVVEVQDPEELQRILLRLQEMGYAPLGAVPGDLLAAAGLAVPGPSTRASAGGGNVGRTVPARGGANETLPSGGGYVSVYDPRYERYALPARDGGGPAAGAGGTMVPYADAWAAARARAADRAARGDIPLAYRQIVRDFFAAEE